MTPPTCPHCAWPIHGLHHVDEAGVARHIGCAEREKPNPEAPERTNEPELDL